MATSYGRRKKRRREEWLPGLVTGVLIALGAWVASWWIVPVAALAVGAAWRERANVANHVMCGAVGGWLFLLLVDSMHGRTWALARALGGAVMLPYGLIIPVTLLFAAGLAWSGAVLAQSVATALAKRRAA